MPYITDEQGNEYRTGYKNVKDTSNILSNIGSLMGSNSLALAPATGGLSLVPTALSFIGGLLDDSQEKALKEQQRANKEAERQRRFEADKKFGFDALGQLTNTAFNARKGYRNSVYNKTLHNVLTGKVAPLQGAA